MRALLVSYVFPPTGGAGVGRALKLCKYLPDHGVEVSVLTVSNPSVPVSDSSLVAEVPPSTRIVRARTLEPGYRIKEIFGRRNPETGTKSADLGAACPGDRHGRAQQVLGKLKKTLFGFARSALEPDPQILWFPGALAALPAIARERPDVAIITAPPFSSFLLAPLLRRLMGIPVILDYRDEWSTCRTTYEHSSASQQAVGAALERWLVGESDAIVTATEGFRGNLLERFPQLDDDCVVTIPNGYDPTDFPQSLADPPSDKLTITYAGTIFRLTRPAAFLEAIRRIEDRRPRLARLLRVRFVGRIVDAEKSAFDGLKSVELLGYRSKSEAMQLLSASHLTLCLLDQLEENRHIFPAKIFELMYLRRPCLTIAPDGLLESLAKKHRLGPVAAADAPDEVERILVSCLEDFAAGRFSARSQPEDIEGYDRRHLAGIYARLMRLHARGGPGEAGLQHQWAA